MGNRARAYWAVGLLFVAFVGVTMTGALYTNSVDRRTRHDVHDVQQQQDRDMCDMLHALLPTPRPSPVTSARAAVERYEQRRCA